MKRQIKKWTALFLVCMITVLSSVNSYAAEPVQEDGASEEESNQLQEIRDQRDQEEDFTPDEENRDVVEGDDQEPMEGSDGESQEEGDGESSDEDVELEEQKDNDEAVDASGQKGEVTEPITKEDKPYLALGANLTPEQQNIVLSLLGINPAELADYDVIYITNEEEHQYLGDYVAADKIGTRSLSSVLVVKRDKGNGINITTKNISYCTIGMYKNALITAGITDADIIVAGPSPISGTAALVGVMKAYSDMTGEKVTEESMDTALNELVLTGELARTVGDSEKAEELIAYLKQEVIGERLKSEGDIREAINKACQEFNIELSEDEILQLVDLLHKIGNLDLDLDSIKDQAKELYDKISQIDIEMVFLIKSLIFSVPLWISLRDCFPDYL